MDEIELLLLLLACSVVLGVLIGLLPFDLVGAYCMPAMALLIMTFAMGPFLLLMLLVEAYVANPDGLLFWIAFAACVYLLSTPIAHWISEMGWKRAAAKERERKERMRERMRERRFGRR